MHCTKNDSCRRRNNVHEDTRFGHQNDMAPRPRTAFLLLIAAPASDCSSLRVYPQLLIENLPTQSSFVCPFRDMLLCTTLSRRQGRHLFDNVLPPVILKPAASSKPMTDSLVIFLRAVSIRRCDGSC